MNDAADELDLQARLRRIGDAAEAYSFWAAASVEATPTVELAAWRLMQLVDGSRHLVGTSRQDGDSGRVSSRLLALDATKAAAITEIGRVYSLVGRLGRSGDSDYAWGRWLVELGSPVWMDVTRAVEFEIERGRMSHDQGIDVGAVLNELDASIRKAAAA